MKKEIHPKYYPNATVKCACGNKFTIGATKEFIETESCSQCHPFYTGKEKNLDRVDQVQKFKARIKRQKEKEKEIEKKSQKDKKKSMKSKKGSQKSKKNGSK